MRYPTHRFCCSERIANRGAGPLAVPLGTNVNIRAWRRCESRSSPQLHVQRVSSDSCWTRTRGAGRSVDSGAELFRRPVARAMRYQSVLRPRQYRHVLHNRLFPLPKRLQAGLAARSAARGRAAGKVRRQRIPFWPGGALGALRWQHRTDATSRWRRSRSYNSFTHRVHFYLQRNCGGAQFLSPLGTGESARAYRTTHAPQDSTLQ